MSENTGDNPKADLSSLIQELELRVEKDPTDLALHFNLGKLYYSAGLTYLDKTITEFLRSAKDPNFKSDSHLFLGHSFQRKRMFERADQHYQEAEKGVQSEDRKLGILYNRAKCLSEVGDLEKATEIGKLIMKLDPGCEPPSPRRA